MELTEELMQMLAKELITAEDYSTPVQPLSERYPQMTTDDSYRLQKLAIKQRELRGEIIVGKRIGLTNKKVREHVGAHEPGFGVIMNSAVMMDNDLLYTSYLIEPRIEAGVAFVLRDGLAGPNATIADVYRATEGVVPVLEVVDSRIKDWKIKTPDVIADNACCARVVLGTKMSELRAVDLKHAGLVVSQNGKIIDTAAGAAVMGHPLHAVAWLANKLFFHGMTLTKGEMVVCGTFIPAFPIKAGDYVEASFGSLGTVSLRVGD